MRSTSHHIAEKVTHSCADVKLLHDYPALEYDAPMQPLKQLTVSERSEQSVKDTCCAESRAHLHRCQGLRSIAVVARVAPKARNIVPSDRSQSTPPVGARMLPSRLSLSSPIRPIAPVNVCNRN